MATIKINGKDYKLKARVGDVNRLVRKYKEEIDAVWKKGKKPDFAINEEKTGEFILDLIWTMIVPRFLFKPYITFERFVENVEVHELSEAGEKAFLLMHGIRPEDIPGEGRDQGNRK